MSSWQRCRQVRIALWLSYTRSHRFVHLLNCASHAATIGLPDPRPCAARPGYSVASRAKAASIAVPSTCSRAMPFSARLTSNLVATSKTRLGCQAHNATQALINVLYLCRRCPTAIAPSKSAPTMRSGVGPVMDGASTDQALDEAD
jgi:hypothetical protein